MSARLHLLVLAAIAGLGIWSLVALDAQDIARVQCRHTSAQPAKC